jgi:hypothetical protein
MTRLTKLFLIFGFSVTLALVLVPSVGLAQTTEEICTDGEDNDKDGATDCEDSDCADKEECKVPPPEAVCHNIGGPDAKGGGANCDPNIDAPCCIETVEIGELCIDNTQYFGIVISNGPNSIAAHIAHGDGEATTIFDPALHLSSSGQNHLGANVECVADRSNEQDPEPGN